MGFLFRIPTIISKVRKVIIILSIGTRVLKQKPACAGSVHPVRVACVLTMDVLLMPFRMMYTDNPGDNQYQLVIRRFSPIPWLQSV